ncbi:hypothetical protein LJ737_03950 [Hymenobacter sp. 15J16-1T3B]|uniref:hypothetical protein n=1 Tax=Hymenobacter sp. 15J16-1T3B TaxID=2886941 RepID=UPI001D102191|nr:hypothetical protein [Hymenobacter sp. 15J16-1T3B]MCC3156375.1 hypothetical protein [Hymenobacter sp. 15J16-1T3B]
MFSFLSSLFSGRQPAPPEQDLSFGLLAARGVPALVRAQRWDEVAALAASLSGDELSRLLDGLCLTDAYSVDLTQLGARPDDEFSRLALGAWYLFQAWQARTAKYGKDLTETEINGFEHYLRLAHERLSSAFESELFRSEARARLVRTEQGFSDVEAAMEAFHESVALDPTKFWAYHHLFKVASPRWFGSREELAEYIESVAEPRVQYALWLMYLVEMYDDLERELENEVTAQRRWYDEQQGLVREVLARPTLPVSETLVSIYANNNLAYVYHLLGEQARRDELLDRLASRFTPYPWAYFGVDSGSAAAMKRFRSSAARAKP